MRVIDVVSYSPTWPYLFEEQKNHIQKALGDYCIAVHHVGSTSIEGLIAKPKIDIILVFKHPIAVIEAMENAGFAYKGEWNIPFKYGFTKRGAVDVNVHGFEEGHPEIELNLMFRDYLRTHHIERDAYASLKMKLLENSDAALKKESVLFSNYNLGKDAFITSILDKAGFNQLRFMRCTHHKEWEAYHRIKQEQIFSKLPVVYDPNRTMINASHHHFILLKGTTVVSLAHVSFLDNQEATLRALATDRKNIMKGYGKTLLGFVERWAKKEGRTILKTHAAPHAEFFYRNLGYVDMIFNDATIMKDVIDLGKKL